MALRHLHPWAALLFRRFGILMGGLLSPSLLLLIIVGGSSSSSSHSPCHHGGSSFSSSPVGIMRATAGLLHWLPILGGSASMAIPPSVTCEVQDVSSLVATPLTNVRVLPLMVSSHPSLLGSSWGVLGGVASPPPCSRWISFYSVYCPRPVCGCGACVSSSPSSC